jgi:hypothetical protein
MPNPDPAFCDEMAMSNDSNYVDAVADVLASDRRRTFLAFLAQELSIAGRENYIHAGDMDQDARVARFASLNEAGHVLGAQLASDAGHGTGYPDTAFAEAFIGKARKYVSDAKAVRVCLMRELERSHTD